MRSSSPSIPKQKLYLGGAGLCCLLFFLTSFNGNGNDPGTHFSPTLIPDGGRTVDLIVKLSDRESALREANSNKHVLVLTDEEVQWLDVLSTGWAAPFTGFMTEEEYLQTVHFNSVLMPNGERVSSPIPIVISATDDQKGRMEGARAITLKDGSGNVLALLDNPSFYPHRKEERIARTFGMMDMGHPYVQLILEKGNWLVGGSVRVISRIKYNDGLDQYRLSPAEVHAEFKKRGADAVVAFQTRNPTHAAHAFLMNEALRKLKERGYKKPMLWLSTLGGWTKDDDVPLPVRVAQHAAIIEDGMLPAEKTVLAIWPSPMIYAGPTEVQWHAKSRRNAGAGYFITGRDPAGLKRSDTGEDVYNPDDGRYVLSVSPGLRNMEIMTFEKVGYDKTIQGFTYYDSSREDDFISISGSKMRALARAGEDPPPGFMAPRGWKIVVQYYQDLAAGKV